MTVEWIGPVVGSLCGTLVFVLIMWALVSDGPRPRRGSYVMPAAPRVPPAMPATGPPATGPVLFHSPYCASRHGSPCDCQRCHCPKGL